MALRPHCLTHWSEGTASISHVYWNLKRPSGPSMNEDFHIALVGSHHLLSFSSILSVSLLCHLHCTSSLKCVVSPPRLLDGELSDSFCGLSFHSVDSGHSSTKVFNFYEIQCVYFLSHWLCFWWQTLSPFRIRIEGKEGGKGDRASHQ